MREVLTPVLELIYPTYCGGCGRQGDLLCPECLDTFVSVDEESACPLCGRDVGVPVVCGACLTRQRHFERGYFGYSFEGPLREALHAFKFRGRKDVGRALVRMLDAKISEIEDVFDVIVPLPVTEKRLGERGFNQSFIICEEISRVTGKPVDHSILRKVKETQDQYTLSREERRKNVARAFGLSSAPGALKGKRVLLVDDLFTTGNTASEAARTLKGGRPQSVFFFALARTPG